jgi:hypothetical protein
MMIFELTDMDFVRSAIYNALAEGVSLDDVGRMSLYAETPEALDAAVNMFILSMPEVEQVLE